MEKKDKEPPATPGKDSPVQFNEETVKAMLGQMLGRKLEVIPSLKVACTSAERLKLDLLADFQAEFKSLTETNLAKMVKEIDRLGFLEPVSVWKNGGFFYILNGHQRVFALRWMVKNNLVECEAGIPVNMVSADDAADASLKCLALASTFGRTDRKGLAKFCKKAKIGESQVQEMFSFVDLDMEDLQLKAGKKKKKVEFEAAEDSGGGDLPEGKLKCPVCSHIGNEEDFEG